jgi:hypothetical protein
MNPIEESRNRSLRLFFFNGLKSCDGSNFSPLFESAFRQLQTESESRREASFRSLLALYTYWYCLIQATMSYSQRTAYSKSAFSLA